MTKEQMMLDRAVKGWKVMMHNLIRAALLKHQEETGHQIAWLMFPCGDVVRNYG